MATEAGGAHRQGRALRALGGPDCALRLLLHIRQPAEQECGQGKQCRPTMVGGRCRTPHLARKVGHLQVFAMP